MNVCMYLCIMYVCMYMSEISYTAVMQLPITFYIHRSMHAMPCIQSCMKSHSCKHTQMSRLSLNNWVDHKWTCGGDPRTAQTPRVHVNARACARGWGEQSQSGEWRRGNRFVSRSPSFPLLSFLPSFRPSLGASLSSARQQTTWTSRLMMGRGRAKTSAVSRAALRSLDLPGIRDKFAFACSATSHTHTHTQTNVKIQ